MAKSAKSHEPPRKGSLERSFPLRHSVLNTCLQNHGKILNILRPFYPRVCFERVLLRSWSEEPTDWAQASSTEALGTSFTANRVAAPPRCLQSLSAKEMCWKPQVETPWFRGTGLSKMEKVARRRATRRVARA